MFTLLFFTRYHKIPGNRCHTYPDKDRANKAPRKCLLSVQNLLVRIVYYKKKSFLTSHGLRFLVRTCRHGIQYVNEKKEYIYYGSGGTGS